MHKRNQYHFIQVVLFIIYFVTFKRNTPDMKSMNVISKEANVRILVRILVRFTFTVQAVQRCQSSIYSVDARPLH